jgi:hypothetical protein
MTLGRQRLVYLGTLECCWGPGTFDLPFYLLEEAMGPECLGSRDGVVP